MNTFASWKNRLGLAIIISCGLWLVTIFCLSIWVNMDYAYWQGLTSQWGFTEFRHWGDSFFFKSLGFSAALFFLAWVAIEITCRVAFNRVARRMYRNRRRDRDYVLTRKYCW